MRTVAYFAIVLLFLSVIGAQRKPNQCKGVNGKTYEIGQGYETKCNKYTCRWTKSKRRKPKMKKSNGNCCTYQGKKYTIGEVITSERINKCSEKVTKCEYLENKGTLMSTTIQENCCHYEGKTMVPGEEIPLAQKCAFITCTNDSQSNSLSIKVKYAGAFCCLANNGIMFPQMAEIDIKHNASEKLFSCCKGYWVHLPVTGNNTQQYCDAKFDPMALPDSPTKRHSQYSHAMEGRTWMKNVLGRLGLHRLSIPGSHDTMAWKSELVIDMFANTHDLTLTEQLNIGVRYLDLRLKNRNGWIGCYHGWVYVHNYLRYAMNDISNFLKENPSETVIFRYWNIGGDNDEFCRRFNMVVNWHNLWNKEVKTFKKLDEMPTLDEARGKIIVINEKSNSNCFGFKFPFQELDNYSPSVSVSGRSYHQKNSNFVKMETIEEHDSENNNYPEFTEDYFSNKTTSKIQPANETISDHKGNINHDTIDLSEMPDLDSTHQFKANQSSIIEPDQKENRFFWLIPIALGVWGGIAIANEITQPNEAYKRELEVFLDRVRGDHNFGYGRWAKDLMLTWASATSVPSCGPKCIASHVNPRINSYLKKNLGGRVGIVVFDYITNWNWDLPRNVYSRNFQAAPRYLEVSANGEAGVWQSSRLGKYKMFDDAGYRNRFSVWQKEGANQFIFMDDFGKWSIGPNWRSNSRGITDRTKNKPLPLGVGWRYYHNGWHTDDTLTVEVVLEGATKCAILYEHTDYQGRFLNVYTTLKPWMAEIYNLVPSGWNDKVSSIKFVSGGRYLYGYQHTKYGGSYQYIGTDTPRMPHGTNDWMSSLKCYK